MLNKSLQVCDTFLHLNVAFFYISELTLSLLQAVATATFDYIIMLVLF